MEAELAEAGALERCVVATAERGAVEVAAGVTDEDQIVVASPVSRLPSFASASATSGAIGTERTLPDFGRSEHALGVARAHADRRAGEVDVAPAERKQLATAQPGERGRQEDRGVLLDAAARTSA